MLSSTKLAVALKADYLVRLQQLGTTVILAPGETLFDVQSSSGEMHVIVRGDINLYKMGQDLPVVWLGAGDILGEIGFILRTPRTATARAGMDGCTLWKLDRRVISPGMDPGYGYPRTPLHRHSPLCAGALRQTDRDVCSFLKNP